MSTPTNSHEIQHKGPETDITELHHMSNADEALINRLDTKHLGYVTPDQLVAATHDKNLTGAERHTAAVMLFTQEDLRYQRLGYLPHLDTTAGAGAPASAEPPTPSTDRPTASGGMAGNPSTDRPGAVAGAGGAAEAAAEAARINQHRPFPGIHVPGSENPDRPENIRLSDVKSFDASVSRMDMGRDMSARGYDQISQDIMHKYAKHDPGKRLTKEEVDHAVNDLSKKYPGDPRRSDDAQTKLEREELDVLKATQNQMNAMKPEGGEPTNHKSAAYKAYEAQINRIPISQTDLTQNVQLVSAQYRNNPALSDALSVERHIDSPPPALGHGVPNGHLPQAARPASTGRPPASAPALPAPAPTGG